jgi:hypothetical protein
MLKRNEQSSKNKLEGMLEIIYPFRTSRRDDEKHCKSAYNAAP